MSGEDLLAGAVGALETAASLGEARRTIDIWAPRFHTALGDRLTAGPRPELRMEVTRVPGPARGGFTARRGNSFFVGIGTEGGREDRFTLAHELAHVVFNSCRGHSFELSRKDEEQLCDLFARRALVPPALIKTDLVQHGAPRELREVRDFAGRFRISLRAALVALDEFFPREWPVAFVAASWRPHPRRKQVSGLRVDCSASDRRFFLPSHCRLSTLGFEELERWAIGARVGDRHVGADAGVSMRSRRPGVSKWCGRSAWTAQRHLAPGSSPEEDGPAVFCQLEVGGLAPAPPKSRPRRASVPTGKPHWVPGQLDLQEKALRGN